MCINESRHDNAPLSVYKLSFRKLLFDLFQSSYFLNSSSVNCYCSIFEKWLSGISCNQTSVSNDQHMALSFSYIITMLSYSYINTWKYHLQGKNTIFFSYSKFFCKKLLQSIFFVLLWNHKQHRNVLQIVYCTKLPYHIMKVRNEEVVHGIHT